ncbi:MAG: P-II family nitrogen regulator [Aquamicrobium sp.]|nr:P-II family nitrogen regulator [Afipia sp.]MBR2691737.1 P-II family nitrogen regulator [Aquamicrobium sp.]
MSTEGSKTLITALIRPHMEGHVVRALHDLPDFPGFTFDEVRGQGRGRGQGGSYISTDTDLTYHLYLELRLVCRSDLAEDICRRIASAAWTGRKGDGVVYTTPVHSFSRVREIGKRPEQPHD